MLFPPFEPDRDEPRRRRFRPIPVRTLLPNVITLLALCAGLTAVRLAIEGKLELALGAIVLAAVLDGIDGRIARLTVCSGKRVGTRVPREMVLPVFVVVVLFVALLLSYPWVVLTLGTLLYLACLPLGFWSYRNYEREQTRSGAALGGEPEPSSRTKSTAAEERPFRLN